MAVETGRDVRAIRRVLILTMLINALATAAKLAAGVVSGSLGVVADALDTLFDAASNVVGLVGLSLSAHPPDVEHPYGHRKFETIAALGIALLLILTSWELLRSAVGRLSAPPTPQLEPWTFAAIVFGIVLQGATSWYELREGRRLRSEVLVADALHTRANTLISISVLVGMGVVRLGYAFVDPILGAGIALYIAKIAFDIVRENVPALVDRAVVDEETVAQVLESVSGVESYHRIRSRGAPGHAAIDLHMRVGPRRPVEEAEAIADEVRSRLLALDGVSDVTIHVEGQRGPDPAAGEIFAVIKQVADGLDLRVHECRAHLVDGVVEAEVHIGVAPQRTVAEAHALVDQLEREALVRLPQVQRIRTHIEPATREVTEGSVVADDLQRQIEQEVMRAVAALPALRDPHDIRVQRVEGRLFLSLTCRADARLSVAEAHRLASELEAALVERRPEIAEVLIHVEPG